MSAWARRNASRAARLTATLVLVAVGPRSASADNRADSLEGRPIRRLEIDAHNIYQPLPRGYLRPLYRLANTLHVRTRGRTIRDAVLLRSGDPWSETRARESERALRALGILERTPGAQHRVRNGSS